MNTARNIPWAPRTSGSPRTKARPVWARSRTPRSFLRGVRMSPAPLKASAMTMPAATKA